VYQPVKDTLLKLLSSVFLHGAGTKQHAVTARRDEQTQAERQRRSVPSYQRSALGPTQVSLWVTSRERPATFVTEATRNTKTSEVPETFA
jgi:hypothetical protein